MQNVDSFMVFISAGNKLRCITIDISFSCKVKTIHWSHGKNIYQVIVYHVFVFVKTNFSMFNTGSCEQIIHMSLWIKCAITTEGGAWQPAT